jgi:hypothetical protein
MVGTADRRDRGVAIATVLVLQALVASWLYRGGVSAPAAAGVDDVLQIEFITRSAPRAARAPRAAPRGRPFAISAPTEGRLHAAVDAPEPLSPARSAMPSVPQPPRAVLDLHVPESPPTLAPRDPLRRRVSVDTASTHFDADWAPAGNVLEQAAFRSRVAGFALHAFGGPPRHCTESERRRRVPDCLPLTAQEDEDERLRRSLDP